MSITVPLSQIEYTVCGNDHAKLHVFTYLYKTILLIFY